MASVGAWRKAAVAERLKPDVTVMGAGGAVTGAGGMVPGAGGAVPGAGGTVPGAGGAVPGAGGTVPGAVEALQIKKLLRCFPSAGPSFPLSLERLAILFCFDWVLIGQSGGGVFILTRAGRRRRVHHLHHAFSIRGVAGAGQKAFETRRV